MRKMLILTVLSMFLSVYAGSTFEIKQLQGAWWSDLHNPTADFAIDGNEVWLDFDAKYHPCKIEGDILIFDLGDGGLVRNRIVSINGDRLVLETPPGKGRRILSRVR